jgi:hypothetical protein
MTADPAAWASVLNSAGANGLALIVMTVLLAATFAASVTLVTLLIRSILKEERIPHSVWVQECQSHTEQMSALSAMASALNELVWTVRALAKNGGV